MMSLIKKKSAFPVIFIPVESKKREFDGKILLTSHLLAAGFKVVLGNKAGVNRELMHARNGIYLAKSASNENLELYRKLHERGHRMVVLDVEGGALTKEIKNDLVRSYQPEACRYFDYIYVFGDKIREAIIRDLDYIRPEQVVVTGEPRFDLLRPEYDSFFENEIAEIKEKYGRFILINTSFGLSNSYHGDEGIRHILETTADIPDEQRHLYILKHTTGKHLLISFIDLAKAIATEFPAVNVVVRPHPDEDPAIYHKLLKDINGVFVNGSGNVQPMIKSATAVIHHDCTTGMESVMAGKPTISFIPVQEESVTAWLPVYLSLQCETTDSVLKELVRIIDGGIEVCDPGAEKSELFADYFENYRSLASEKITRHLNQHYGEMVGSLPGFSAGLHYARLLSAMNVRRVLRDEYTRQRGRFIRIDKNEVAGKLLRSGQHLPATEIVVRGSNVVIIKSRG